MYLWIVIVGGFFAFFAAAGIGANDAANAFATSVGSKAITFNQLIEKYKIEYINKLIIDAEGFDYNIIKSIDFKKIFIKEIIFEKKHLSTTFQIGSKLNEIKAFLAKEKYKLFDISKENILAKKTK